MITIASMVDDVREMVCSLEDKIVDMICDHIEDSDNNKIEVPKVKYEDGLSQNLYVNGELVCSHDKLYPLDILICLDSLGIISISE